LSTCNTSSNRYRIFDTHLFHLTLLYLILDARQEFQIYLDWIAQTSALFHIFGDMGKKAISYRAIRVDGMAIGTVFFSYHCVVHYALDFLSGRKYGGAMKWLGCLLSISMLIVAASCSRKPVVMETTADPSADAAPSTQVFKSPNELAKDLNWLVANSPFVYVGHVTRQSSEQDSRGLIVTKNEFAVDRVIIGNASRTSVSLTTLGGSVGDKAMRVSHMPEFARDTTYLIFTDLTRTVYNPITGNAGGVFIVDNGGVFTYDGLALAAIENGLIQLNESSMRRTDPQKAVATADDPKVDGAIVSVQRTEVVQGRALTLDEFSAAILSAVRK
jgi:hypothetical protein